MIVSLDLLQQCAPNVAPITMIAIIKTESKYNPWAIGLNKGKKLRYQPHSLEQAEAWVTYLEKNGYDFDIGLGQVNIRNVHKYGYNATQLLTPCLNLKVASDILQKNYKKAFYKTNHPRDALMMAISAYNTGNYHAGFSNGYVDRVVNNASSSKTKPPYNNIHHNKRVDYANIQSSYGKIKLKTIKPNLDVEYANN